MSSKKTHSGDFLNRLLRIVESEANGKPATFAKKAGIPPSTFQYYAKGRLPRADHLKRICVIYNVNINWLLTGEGDLFIKKNKKSGVYNKECLDEDPEISDLLKGARRVLKSGNQVAFDALERNIRYFDHAIKTENRLIKLEAEMATIKKLIKDGDKKVGENQSSPSEDPKQKSA